MLEQDICIVYKTWKLASYQWNGFECANLFPYSTRIKNCILIFCIHWSWCLEISEERWEKEFVLRIIAEFKYSRSFLSSNFGLCASSIRWNSIKSLFPFSLGLDNINVGAAVLDAFTFRSWIVEPSSFRTGAHFHRREALANCTRYSTVNKFIWWYELWTNSTKMRFSTECP